MIGAKGDKFVPFFTSIFFFVWAMNIMSFIPFAQFPPTSRVAFPAIRALGWVPYMYLTFNTTDSVGGVKNLVWFLGTAEGLVHLILPLEFI